MVRAVVVVSALVFMTGLAEAKPDFQNFTYKPGCLGSQPVRLKKGAAQKDGMTLAVSDVVEGDLDGDGKPEYTVVLTCDADEGSGRFTEGYVYRVVGGKPVLAVTLPTGDRAHGGIEKVEVTDGELVVTRNTTRDGACCPEWWLVQWFKLTKQALVETRTHERNLPNANGMAVKTVKFEKGRSTWTTNIDQTVIGSEFQFAARAKQTLVVTVTPTAGKPQLVVFDAISYLPLTIISPDDLTFTDTREKAGAWQIIVVPQSDATSTDLSYKLTVSIK
ncbi:MAG TPA: hypothetical protein VGM90_21715 [Kofleriaceae bacterium]